MKTIPLIFGFLSVSFLSVCLTFAQSEAPKAPFTFDGKSWWEHVKVIADDNMEGRETGSEGLNRAEAYIVEQAKSDGLKPASNDGYYQKIKFIEGRLDEAQSSLALVRDGKTEVLALGDDAILGTRVDGGEVDAPAVFVGYGLKVPEKNYDDLAGLDLTGKGGGDLQRFAERAADGIGFALPIGKRALEIAQAGRRGWRNHSSESGIDGHSLVAHQEQPAAALDATGRPERDRRGETGRGLQSRLGTEVV